MKKLSSKSKRKISLKMLDEICTISDLKRKDFFEVLETTSDSIRQGLPGKIHYLYFILKEIKKDSRLRGEMLIHFMEEINGSIMESPEQEFTPNAQDIEDKYFSMKDLVDERREELHSAVENFAESKRVLNDYFQKNKYFIENP